MFSRRAKFFKSAPALFSKRSFSANITPFNSPIRETIANVNLEYELNHKRQTDRFERQKQQQFSEDFVLGVKKPSDSHVRVVLPFSKEKRLRDSYLDNHGSIRMGRLLEDLDSLAGEIAYKHSDGFHPKRPVTIVTASVDRIQLQEKIIPYFDLTLEGHVTQTGRSSMEVRMDVTTQRDGETFEVIVAYFTMVAKDRVTGKAVEVHKVEPQTESEKLLFVLGNENKVRRTHHSEKSLMKQPPSEEEKLLIHNMFLKMRDRNSIVISDPNNLTTVLDKNERFMNSSVMNTTRLMYPQNRNIHNKIFGGYLLRQAYEIAEITATLFSKDHPMFLSLDDNAFLKPVEIGSILSLSSSVVYTTNTSCVVRVEAKVLHANIGSCDTTNIFHFSFQVPTQAQVVPQSYEEAIMFLEGKRIWEKGLKLQQEITRVKTINNKH